MKFAVLDGVRVTTLLVILTLAALLDRASCVKWLGIHRARHKSWNSPNNCTRKLGLVREQIRQCKDNLDLMPNVVRAATASLETCQNLFSNGRWNCSSIQLFPGRPKDLTRGTREKAYVYSLASAALVHTIGRACTIGVTTKCSCSALPNTTPSGNFKWGGCGDDVDFSEFFGKRFTDATLHPKKGKSLATKGLVDEHNFSVGRQIVRDSLVVACKCHGVSGSCSIKTCWKAQPDFDLIGAALKSRYAFAVEVKRRKRKKLSVLTPVQPGKTFANNDLVYYVKSPDYCYPDEMTGSVGTRGRLCDPKAEGLGNCGTMCCGRGAVNFTMEIQERCECKYYWCCYVKCKTCTRLLHLSKCK